jgi:flagellar hook assembly protein FlgD
MTGYHTVLWDGKDKKGLQVSSGMYYYGIKTPNFNKFKKLVLLK